jgi:hypothetical protein
METFPFQAELLRFSKTESSDEERLLQLFRRLPWKKRSEVLYGVTRRCSAEWFAECFDDAEDARDSVYLQEELEEYLRCICPRERLGPLWDAIQGVYFESLWISAWGRIAPVILGASDHDGQRADELFAAIVRHCSEERIDLGGFDRRDALDLIGAWREEVLQRAFSAVVPHLRSD